MGHGAGAVIVPFAHEKPAEEHVDDHAATAKNDVDGHGYVECKRGIVEGREHKKEGDLEEIGQEGHAACPEPERPAGLYADELCGECVEGDDGKLEEGDEDARVWVGCGESLCRDRVAAAPAKDEGECRGPVCHSLNQIPSRGCFYLKKASSSSSLSSFLAQPGLDSLYHAAPCHVPSPRFPPPRLPPQPWFR